MKLINSKTKQPVHIGEVAHDFRGKAAVITGWQVPQHTGSTGRIDIREMDEHGLSASYYPSVYGMEWVA